MVFTGPAESRIMGKGFPGGPVAKAAFPMQEAPRSIPGWGTRSHMPQL